MVGWHSGTGSGHSARCWSADSCHCCCHGDSMFTVATHLCVAFRRYLVNRKLKATRRNKPRQFIDFCNRNMFSETPSKAVNIVSKYLFESKTIRLKMALQYPQTPEDSCGKRQHENETCGGSFHWTRSWRIVLDGFILFLFFMLAAGPWTLFEVRQPSKKWTLLIHCCNNYFLYLLL